MATDTERNHTGTNFAAATVIILAMLAVLYYVVTLGRDVADDDELTKIPVSQIEPGTTVN